MSTEIANEVASRSPAHLLVTGDETGGTFAVFEMHVTSSSPRHAHAHEDEIVYVLEGHLSFTRAGQITDVPAGACITLPRTIEHSYRVLTNEARLLVIVTPAGLENFYREVGTPGSLPAEQLVSTAARYGITITGPTA